MSKKYKAIVKEYAMGLQVPSMSYLKPMAALNPLRKKENVKVREKLINDTADARPEDSETLGAEKIVNANETDELDDKRDKAVESETVALAGQSIEIVIDEAPSYGHVFCRVESDPK